MKEAFKKDWVRIVTAIIAAAALIAAAVIAANNNFGIAHFTVDASKTASAENKTETAIANDATSTAFAVATSISDSVQKTLTAYPFSSRTTATITPSPPSTIVPSTSTPAVIVEKFLNLDHWQPPSDPNIVFVNGGSLFFQITDEQAKNDIDSSITYSAQNQFYREIDFTMTMVSFARKGEAAVTFRAIMTDGRDNTVAFTHDQENAAIETSFCNSNKCNGNYSEYKHGSDSPHKVEGIPVYIKVIWDGNELSIYADNIKQGSIAAKGTPIGSFEFVSYVKDGGAFTVKIDDMSMFLAKQ